MAADYMLNPTYPAYSKKGADFVVSAPLIICFYSRLFSGRPSHNVSVAHDRLRRRLPEFVLP